MTKTIKSLAKMLTVIMAVSVMLAVCCYTALAAFDYTPVEVIVPVTCEISGRSAEDTYEFVLEKTDAGSASVVKKGQIRIDGSGSDTFTIVVNEPGTYRFKVYEKTGSNSNIIYDDTVYQVTIFVTNDEKGQLEYQVILSKGDSVKPTDVIFVNSAKNVPSPIVSTGETESFFTAVSIVFLSSGAALLLAALRKRREAENA